MERLGKINKVDIFYLHWDDPKREFYLDWLPDKIYSLFVIADDENRREDYEEMSKFFGRKKVDTVNSAGKEYDLLHDIFDIAIPNKEEFERSGNTGNFLDGTAVTNGNENFDWGFWMTTQVFYDHETIDEIICIDFTKRRVKKYLKLITKIVRKDWSPRSLPKGVIPPKEPIYDDEIKKPLRKSQKGFEKD
jgi:hypothetical protein